MDFNTLGDYFKKDLVSLRSEYSKICASGIVGFDKILDNYTKNSGKNIRALLLIIFSRSNNTNHSNANFYAACIELFHLATLVHDDIIDESSLRRGKKSAHLDIGVKLSILLGDFLSLRIINSIEKEDNSKILRLFLNAGEGLLSGELSQLVDSQDISENNYYDYINKKTGSLFSCACASGLSLIEETSDNINKANIFGSNFGIAFQIFDDIIDLLGDNDTNKDIHSDLKNNVFTLPIIHLIQKEGIEKTVKPFVNGQIDFIILKQKLIDYKSFEYAIQIGNDYFNKAIDLSKELLKKTEQDFVIAIINYVKEKANLNNIFNR